MLPFTGKTIRINVLFVLYSLASDIDQLSTPIAQLVAANHPELRAVPRPERAEKGLEYWTVQNILASPKQVETPGKKPRFHAGLGDAQSAHPPMANTIN